MSRSSSRSSRRLQIGFRRSTASRKRRGRPGRPVQAGPQGPQLPSEPRGGRGVTRKGRSEAEDVRSTLTRRPSRSYAPRPPDKLQCVPGADPGLVGLPPLPVTRLRLRVRQGHDHSTPLRNGPVTGGSTPGRSRHRAATGSTAAALQRAGPPDNRHAGRRAAWRGTGV